ncbi:hypothetical protein A3B45_03765 [Candidatus Daviesbacteria bacterium RIFCSPLOWO2_01_FULL_39_12]|uniref:PDZ domain-containing protein n=1 Tax=Candidatus Daviesbacteria bacterium RIFCSPLOWO2_01_FULL_39_12 TaxID=1797785 RepID=A0A1F5KTX4_9BACT|nr:MAG: hypothetical protein A3B45_03765 [Candidatus Daviesbacteria bacterium RIFCSPLOWO2_01_FULL_39_12]
MAKKFGIKVLEFGFGLPPRVWGKKIGETLFSLNLLPLGGFVKLLGEDDLPAGKQEADKKVLNDSRSFAKAKVEKRIVTVLAGVVMNLLLAWVLFYFVIIQQGFRIIYPTADPGVFIARTETGFPAQTAGVKIGDRLLTINGKKVDDVEEAVAEIKGANGQPLRLELADLEGNFKRVISLTPKENTKGEKLIGVVFSPVGFKVYETFWERIFSGVTYSYDLTRLTFVGLGRLLADAITGNFEKASASVSGPVGLARVTNNILSAGVEAVIPYLWFSGVISLTLAIFNVLPIPALDGGRLFFLVIEAVTRKKVHVEIERMIHNVGFALLIALSLLVALSDIRKQFP